MHLSKTDEILKGFCVGVTATGAGETKLLVRRGNIEVKVEVNFVLRGTVHKVRLASLSAKAQDILQAELEIPVASLEDIYGGKLVAALDRQHPRDRFASLIHRPIGKASCLASDRASATLPCRDRWSPVSPYRWRTQRCGF